jgi:hypothetical protein
MKRVLIIANKTWEAEPLINALLNPEFKPKELIVPVQLNHPRKYGQVDFIPRATIVYEDLGISYEIWCVQDLMDPNKHPSSSKEKYTSLPFAFSFRNRKAPDFVIAFGTAGFQMPKDAPGGSSNNGCVSIGTNVFIHDGHPGKKENEYSDLHIPDQFERELLSPAANNFITQLMASADYSTHVEKRLLKPFLNPATDIRLLLEQNQVALSNVNVTSSGEYDDKDKEGVAAVEKSGTTNPITSIETTHGIIRLLADCPFLFVSGITDRMGFFNADVIPRKESQNYTCAFNAGIAVAWMIPELSKYLGKGIG